MTVIQQSEFPRVSCARCGNFIELAHGSEGVNSEYCNVCNDRSSLLLADIVRREYQGRRDAFVFFIVPFLTLVAVFLTIHRGRVSGLFTVVDRTNSVYMTVLGISTLGYIFLQTWGRKALFWCWIVLPIVWLNQVAVFASPGSWTAYGVCLLVFLTQFISTRNQLAFSLKIDEEQLERFYYSYHLNKSAHYSVTLGFFAMFVPLISILAIGAAIFGITALNQKSERRVGGFGMSLLGGFLGLLFLLRDVFLIVAIATMWV